MGSSLVGHYARSESPNDKLSNWVEISQVRVTNDDKPLDGFQHCRFCAGANTSQGFQDCIEQETFNNSAKAQRGVGFQRFVDPSLWTWDVTAAIDGRCFTLNFDEPLTIDLSVDSLVFNLEEDMVYYLFIHQPDHTSYLSQFFLVGVNFYRFNEKNWHFRQILRLKVAFFLQI